jgi:hypothetical protein
VIRNNTSPTGKKVREMTDKEEEEEEGKAPQKR